MSGTIPSRELSPHRLFARWLLLGAVIAGVLTMHILGGHDAGVTGQSMMSGSAVMTPVTTPMPDPTFHHGAVASPVAAGYLKAAAGSGMSDMSCCILFLVAAVGLALLVRSCRARAVVDARRGLGGAGQWAAWLRGPPGTGRPRIALSILRV